jgi:hypothetical protein
MGGIEAGGSDRRSPFAEKPPGIDDIWAFGRYELRLSEDEFWNMCPLQFNLLVKKHNDKHGVKTQPAAQPKKKSWQEIQAAIRGSIPQQGR